MARCETCGGSGTILQFRRFAGEYVAGEDIELECPDCDGEPDNELVCLTCEHPVDENGWCIRCDGYGLTEEVKGDPLLRKDAA